MSTAAITLPMRVAEAQTLNPLIRMLRLSAADGGPLPAWSPGAHIKVQVTLPDGGQDWRQYSLIDLEGKAGGVGFAPDHYLIAVRREDEGRGGSRFMHQGLQAGDALLVEAPKNDFAMHECSGKTLLLAGGIGITPMASMAAHCVATRRPVELHYAGRSRAFMAFLPELQALLGQALQVHADDESAGAGFDIAALLDGCADQDQLYVCGPKPLLDSVLAQTQARGWSHDRVHFELFTAPQVEAGDHEFEVELVQSGKTFMVPVGKTILDCMIEQGCDPMFDCNRGECGVCAMPVIEGEIDHRDYVLTQRERDAGNVIQVCVSRAKGARLVIDA